jgi:hypothetical protein
MIFSYNGYQHPNNECMVTHISRRARYTPRGIPINWIVTMTVEGELIASGQTAIDARIREILNAYALDGGTAVLLRDDGSETIYKIDGSVALTNKVIGPTFPAQDFRAHFATGQPFSIAFVAEIPVNHAVWSYNETITVIGTGGPRVVWPELDNGLAIPQIVSSNTNVIATQSGYAVGVNAMPEYNLPIYPNNIDLPHGYHVTWEAPNYDENGNKFVRVGWDYHFTSNRTGQLPPPRDIGRG